MSTQFTVANSTPLLEQMGMSQFVGKRIGYYTGSFDPFHNGHQRLVEQILKEELVDYVLICPAPGGDQYKNRSDVALRKEMVRAACKANTQIIGTDLTPAQMQDLFTPYLKQIEITGIIGSDVVMDHLADTDEKHKKKVAEVFMRGVKIPEKYGETTIGTIMALPATSFIVSLRDRTDLSHLNGIYQERPIRAFVRVEGNYSSTKVREAVSKNEPVGEMVHPSVEKIIEERGLYK